MVQNDTCQHNNFTRFLNSDFFLFAILSRASARNSEEIQLTYWLELK